MNAPTVHRLPPLVRELLGADAGTPSLARPISQSDMVSGRAHSPADEGQRCFAAINLEEAQQTYDLVRELQPEHALEIGFCSGMSTLCILQAMEDNGRGTHHVVDPFQSSYARGTGLANVRAAGLSHRLDFHEAFPEEVVPRLPEIGFAFIDASHLFDLTILDCVLADKRLRTGGVIGLHDLWMPSLQAVFRFLLKNRAYRFRNPVTGYRLPWKARFRRLLAACLRPLPGARRVFHHDLLEPWETYGVGNLVFLEKRENDVRDWRHFEPF